MNSTKTNDFDIRHLNFSDFDELFDLLRLIYEQQPSEWPMGGIWTRSLLKSELEEGHALGAFDARRYLRGFILYRSHPIGPREITLLASHPKFRNQGLMSALLKNLQDEKPSEEIWLEVHEKNAPAHHLYEKLGFKKTGSRKKYYRDGAAAILYSLTSKENN